MNQKSLPFHGRISTVLWDNNWAAVEVKKKKKEILFPIFPFMYQNYNVLFVGEKNCNKYK